MGAFYFPKTKGFFMSRQIQIRRGTADENNGFTGAIGEITMDTTNNTLRVHDGETLGGTTLAKKSDLPDLNSIDYVVESQLPTPENNYTWYRKYKSGWIEQGGTLTTYPASEETTITFLVPFADDKYYANRTLNYAVSNTDWCVYNGGVVYNKTATTMCFRHKGPVSWCAYGKSAE